MKRGIIVILNGASSSGKTTLAKEIMSSCDIPFVQISIDNITSVLPNFDDLYEKHQKKNGNTISEFEFYNKIFNPLVFKLIKNYHELIVDLAKANINIIADHVFQKIEYLKDCVMTLNGHKVVYIGIKCSIKELQKREIERENRLNGQACQQLEIVHKYDFYDIVMDTTITSPIECAKTICNYLEGNKKSMAFSNLMKIFQEEH